MPSIPVHSPTTPSAPSESPLPPLLYTPLGLALVEIQGTLHVPSAPSPDADPTSPLLQIGRLEFPLLPTPSDATAQQPGPWMKKVYFYVGDRQRLVGEVKKLEKAFAVLKRRESTDDKAGREELDILDVVRYKLHFAERPEFV